MDRTPLVVSDGPPLDVKFATPEDFVREAIAADLARMHAEGPGDPVDYALRVCRRRFPDVEFEATATPGGAIRLTAHAPRERLEELRALGWRV